LKLSNSSKTITFNHDGKMIAYATGEQIYRQINPNPGTRASVADTSKVEIRKVRSGKTIQSFDFFAASSIAFSPDNSMIAMGGYGGEIEIWRIKDRKLLYSFRDGEHYFFETLLLSFSPDGKTFIAAVGDSSFPISSRPGQVSVRNLSEGQIKYTLSERYSCAASSPDGQLLAFGEPKVPLTIYRVNDEIPLRAISNIFRSCRNLNFSQDSKLLAFVSLSSERDANIYSLEENKLLRKFIIDHRNDRHYYSDTAMSSNSKYLAVSYIIDRYGDGFLIPSYPKAFFSRIRIWNVENGRLIKTFAGHRKGINAISFSPDGKWLASAGRDSTIKLWRMPPYSGWLWFLGSIALAVFVFSRRTELREWINR